MDVLARLDETRGAISVLEHPFYERWSAGELSASELVVYAGEYRHAVRALAETSAKAAAEAGPAHAPVLHDHAAEEAEHVSLWDQFARAAGAPEGAPGDDEGALEETEACVGAWTAGQDVLEHLAVLYALEASQPEISRTKIAGLTDHYGYTVEGPAVEYFRVHATRDEEHAGEARRMIFELMETVEDRDEKANRMLRCAGAALRGNWLLLDGVEERARRSDAEAPTCNG